MPLEFLATIGKFFKGILGSFGFIFKFLFSKMGLMGILGWRMFIFITIVLVLIGNSIGTAVKEKDPMIVIRDFGSFLMSTDTAIEEETNRVLEEGQNFNAWQWIFSFLKIMSNFYMIYFMYWLLFKMFDFFSNQSMPIAVKFMWSTLIVICLRLIYIILMISTQQLSFHDNFDSNVFRLILPYHGIVLFFQNITLWTQPIVNFLNK